MNQDYNVCGVLVMCTPESTEAVVEELNSREGVEVHASESSRLVVTVEGPNDRNFANKINDFSNISGVMSTSLVYHEIDTEPFTESAVSSQEL